MKPEFLDSLINCKIVDGNINQQINVIFLGILETSKKKDWEFLNNFPISEPILESDGNAIIEWDFPNLILTFDIDSDSKYSSWALTIRDSKGNFYEDGGSMQGYNIHEIFPLILDQKDKL